MKETYLKIRGDIKQMFFMYCDIKKVKVDRTIITLAEQFLDAELLQRWLDTHFEIKMIITKGDKIIKVI